jgi:hypothetical protein
MATTGGFAYPGQTGLPGQTAPTPLSEMGVVEPLIRAKPIRVKKRRSKGPKNGGKGKGPGNRGKGGGGQQQAPQQPQNPYAPYMPQVRAAAQLQFGPQQQALRTQGQNIAPFFQQYLDQLEGSRVAQNAYYAGAIQASQQNAAGAAVGAPTGAAPTEKSKMAGEIREGMLSAFSELLRAQDASTNALKEDQKTVGAAARLSAQTQNQQAKTNLKTQKGAFKVDYAEQLRQTGHRENLENAAFGLDAAEVKIDARNERAERKQETRENRRERRNENREPNKYGIPAGDWRKMSTAERQAIIKADKNSGGAKADEKKPVFTPKEKAANRTKLRTMAARVRAKDNGVSTYGKDTVRAMIDAGVDPVLARAAVAKALGKPIPAWLQRKLRKDYGIKIGSRGKVVKRPTPYSPPQNFPGSDAAQG